MASTARAAYFAVSMSAARGKVRLRPITEVFRLTSMARPHLETDEISRFE